jgi:hypothetical protein
MTNSQGSGSQTTILFLSADPKNAERLRNGQELRDIMQCLKMSENLENFSIEPRLSIRSGDVMREMLNVKPQIVHFSGHCTDAGELLFEDESGGCNPILPEALASLFKMLADNVKCVVLNACFSERQARAIAQHIPFVVGMQQSIGDRSAIDFAVGFYTALSASQSIENAYEYGCIQMRMCQRTTQQYLTPILIKREDVLRQVKWGLILEAEVDGVNRPQVEIVLDELKLFLKEPAWRFKLIEINDSTQGNSS